MTSIRFSISDLSDVPLAPGWYPAQISSARLRRSANGNLMVHVVFVLDGRDDASARLAEYFVLEGASAHGLATARRRLARLYRAAGHDPKPDDEIVLAHLVGSQLEVEVDRDSWQGQPRLRVVGHRLRDSGPGADEPPF